MTAAMNAAKAALLCLAVALAACQPTGPRAPGTGGASLAAVPSVASMPSYTGRIDPVAEPVLVRYRPFPRARFNLSSSVQLRTGGQARTTTSAAAGTIDAGQTGEGVAYTFSLDGLLVDGRPDPTAAPASVRVEVSDRGEVRSLDLVGVPGAGTASSADAEAAEGRYADLFRGMIPEVAERPVSTGDVLLTGTVAYGGLAMTYTGTVVGRTTHRGRDALVLEMAGRMNGAPLRGYGLIDIATGAFLLGEITALVNGPSPQGPVFARVRSRQELAL